MKRWMRSDGRRPATAWLALGLLAAVSTMSACRRQPPAPAAATPVGPAGTAAGQAADAATQARIAPLRAAGIGSALVARVLRLLPDPALQVNAVALSAGSQALLLRVTDAAGVVSIESLDLEPAELAALQHAVLCRDGERCGHDVCPACGPASDAG